MRQAISQESVSDSGHSYSSLEREQTTASRVKSAAMLGIALSVGASGALISTVEASAAVSAPTGSDTTKAFSSESKALANDSSNTVQNAEVVAYHTVESGESLWQIAQKHRVGLQDLKVANELPPETAIRVGQVLRVPGNETGIQIAVIIETDETAQITAEEAASITEPVLTAQPAEIQPAEIQSAEIQSAEIQSDAQVRSHQANRASALRTEAIAGAPTFEITERVPSIEIEIADASTQVAAQPSPATVVTALALPQSFGSYQIQAGDTLASIASSLGITTQDIVYANGLSNPNVIITGSTLRVPAVSAAVTTQETVAKKVEASRPAAAAESTIERGVAASGVAASGVAASGVAANSYKLAYLQSTAARPDSARILSEIRSNSPVEATGVGAQAVTEQDVIGSAVSGEAQSVDPYVANLLEDVQAVRETAVQVSEVATTEIEGANDRPSLLARSVSRADHQQVSEQQVSEEVALVPETTLEADSELLAAAPLSPNAYIPAQRPMTGQVVSPNMPLLPSSEEFLPEAPERFNGYIWPAQGIVTSGYGWRWGRMHRGVDVAGPVGTPIVAAAIGVVERAGWNSGGFGNLVEIRHPDGSLTRYAHNNRLNVSTGQAVKQGQKIAEMGSTGYSTGPHLHFEVHMSGRGAVNPVAYLPGR